MIDNQPPQKPPPLSRTFFWAGWACLAAGLYAMFSSLWLILVYGPLFLAAFATSIVALSRRRILGGILLLLASLALPGLLWPLLAIDRSTTSLQQRYKKLLEVSDQRRQEAQENGAPGTPAPATPPAKVEPFTPATIEPSVQNRPGP